MAETNGYDPEQLELALPDELDALLAGSFEPTWFEVAPGRSVEIRPLLIGQADQLYAGGLAGAGLQRFLMARCVFINGRPIGEAGAARLPVILANKLVPDVMKANGMEADTAPAEGEEAAPADPKP
jgi:hypothetical protein